MTRIRTLSQLAAAPEPPPRSVWAMTMGLIGFAFGVGSSPTQAERKSRP